MSFSSGIVPDNLKIAKVILIHKKGDMCSPTNYRPISLLSIFNKLLEKLAYKRLYGFFQKENVIYKYQFGFRKNHSSSMAVLEAVDFCYKCLDSKHFVLGIYFDLQKAFDTVDHVILMHKLYNYGIRGPMYNWIKSYLEDRRQFTFCSKVSSNLKKLYAVFHKVAS